MRSPSATYHFGYVKDSDADVEVPTKYEHRCHIERAKKRIGRGDKVSSLNVVTIQMAQEDVVLEWLR